MFVERAIRVFEVLRAGGQAEIQETVQFCRIDGARCNDAAVLQDMVQLAMDAAAEQFGSVELERRLGGSLNLLSAVTLADVAGEDLSLIIRKSATADWCYFLSLDGLSAALPELGRVGAQRTIWIARDFANFSTGTLHFCQWGGPRHYGGLQDDMERPRKLVRDQTHGLTPEYVAPWLPVNPEVAVSDVFERFRAVAVHNLAYVLPSEIRSIEGQVHVVPRGPRSLQIPVDLPPAGWEQQGFDLLVKAATWVYSLRRDTESKFTFLNNQLSLDWREGDSWPGGLVRTLQNSIASAQLAFAFYLQDQSRDALKLLSDLRKSLQEEVAKTQQATRELLSALWRDFAIAALVLALRSPPISSTTVLHPELLRIVTLAAAALLLISLLVTLISNARFNSLANKSRADWRFRLYSFLGDDDWERLFESQLRAGRWMYRYVAAAMVLAYIAAISYLLNLAEPGLIGKVWAGLRHTL